MTEKGVDKASHWGGDLMEAIYFGRALQEAQMMHDLKRWLKRKEEEMKELKTALKARKTEVKARKKDKKKKTRQTEAKARKKDKKKKHSKSAR